MRNKKIQICKIKKLDQPALGAGVMDTVAGTALDMFVHHGLPSQSVFRNSLLSTFSK